MPRGPRGQEHQNLTMPVRRLAGLTNAFKKVKNHAYAVALHMMYYKTFLTKKKPLTCTMLSRKQKGGRTDCIAIR